MITKLAHFEVRREAIPQAVAAVKAFVDEVKRKEGGTARYEAYQSGDGTQFTHVISFRVASAEQYHQKTAWHKRFHETIGPLCTKPFLVTDATPVE